jgi:glycosyltransferase involved in cell wall biosynthesis
MRLLYLSADPGVPILGHKGASVHVRALAGAFHELGCEVVIASPRIEPGENELPEAVRLEEIPGVRPRACATEGEVAAQAERQADAVTVIAREIGAGAIYERFSLASFAGARAAAAVGIPLALEVNAPLRDEELRFRDLRHPDFARAAEQQAFAAAARVFAVSRPLAEWLATHGVDATRVEVVPNAFPVAPIARGRDAGAAPELVAGFAGGLKRWHGIDVLLEAFRRALDAGGRVRLEIAGTGPAEDLVQAAGLPAEKFEWFGHLPHREALARLGSWDVGLAPFASVPGFWFSPLKLFEYMAAGLAVIASDLGDIPSVLGDGTTGLLVPPGDAGALADALLLLDRDRELVRELGARAARAAASGPTWIDNARRALSALGASAAAA